MYDFLNMKNNILVDISMYDFLNMNNNILVDNNNVILLN